MKCLSLYIFSFGDILLLKFLALLVKSLKTYLSFYNENPIENMFCAFMAAIFRCPFSVHGLNVSLLCQI